MLAKDMVTNHSDKFPKTKINSKLLFVRLSRKFPAAFEAFSNHIIADKNDINRLMTFIEQYQLKLMWRITNPVKTHLSGTYSYRLELGRNMQLKLKRKSNYFSYYGLSTSASAFEKGIEKAFQIIDSILRQK